MSAAAAVWARIASGEAPFIGDSTGNTTRNEPFIHVTLWSRLVVPINHSRPMCVPRPSEEKFYACDTMRNQGTGPLRISLLLIEARSLCKGL
jgi:hypothetical protein